MNNAYTIYAIKAAAMQRRIGTLAAAHYLRVRGVPLEEAVRILTTKVAA